MSNFNKYFENITDDDVAVDDLEWLYDNLKLDIIAKLDSIVKDNLDSINKGADDSGNFQLENETILEIIKIIKYEV